ncbi:MAG: AI-2E family transporter [Deltaproteobacteria bacterium]|nr:AI-2E family transporter [Deltaproteobacteria bacterium]
MLNMLKDWFERRLSDPQVVILWLILIGSFLCIFFFGKMLTPLFAGLIIAYLLEGMVHWFTRLSLPRNAAIILTFFLFIICMLLLVIWLIPLLSRQVGQLIHELPALIANGQKRLMQLPQKYPEFISESLIRELIVYMKSELTIIGQNIVLYSVASVRNLITLMVYLILVPFLVFFFLKDKNLILNWFKNFLPEHTKLASNIWNEVNSQIANYVQGKIWEIIIVWSATYMAFSFLKLNFAMLISFFIGLSVLVPYIGATIMTIPVALMAFFQWGIGHQFVYAVTAYSVIQLIDGNILVPILLSGVVNLHPVAIIGAILIFGGLWGIWGLFFAIPLATLVHALINAWFLRSDAPGAEGNIPPRLESANT